MRSTWSLCAWLSRWCLNIFEDLGMLSIFPIMRKSLSFCLILSDLRFFLCWMVVFDLQNAGGLWVRWELMCRILKTRDCWEGWIGLKRGDCVVIFRSLWMKSFSCWDCGSLITVGDGVFWRDFSFSLQNWLLILMVQFFSRNFDSSELFQEVVWRETFLGFESQGTFFLVFVGIFQGNCWWNWIDLRCGCNHSQFWVKIQFTRASWELYALLFSWKYLFCPYVIGIKDVWGSFLDFFEVRCEDLTAFCV